MKKNGVLALFLLIALSVKSQGLAIGNRVPTLSFENLIVPGTSNTIVRNVSIDDYKGKVILFDFWATWCGACITSMSKLEDLSKKFAGKLQVFAITNENIDRIQRFIKNRPTSLTVVVDSSETFRALFPYRTIPHVILIDKNGIIRAITHSDEITEQTIADVLQNKTVSLPVKSDNTEFDYDDDYFKADSTTKESFNLQPGIDGVGGFSKVGKGVFTNRRISLHNVTIENLFITAYKKSYFRTINLLDSADYDYDNPKNRYCLDVIVPNNNGIDLYLYMQQKLPQHFQASARLEKKKKEVYVLRRTSDTVKFSPSTEANDYYSSNSNHFTGKGVRISSIAQFIEDFGITRTPVLDETGVEGRFDIHMEFEPEKKGSFREALRKIGLSLEKVEREIEILVIYKKPN